MTALEEENVRRTDEDFIIDFLNSEPGTVELSESRVKKLERFSYIDDQMRIEPRTMSQAVNLLMNKFPSLTKQQARRDFLSAKFVFGTQSLASKQYARDMAGDMIIKAFQMAVVQKDAATMVKAGKEYGKIYGVDKDEMLPPNLSLSQTTFNITIATAESLGLPKIINLDERMAKYKKKREVIENGD